MWSPRRTPRSLTDLSTWGEGNVVRTRIQRARAHVSAPGTGAVSDAPPNSSVATERSTSSARAGGTQAWQSIGVGARISAMIDGGRHDSCLFEGETRCGVSQESR
jgi:hypothetical protein